MHATSILAVNHGNQALLAAKKATDAKTAAEQAVANKVSEKSAAKKSAAKKSAANKVVDQTVVREQVGMRRWLRLTARKSAESAKTPQKAGNPAAAAAAEALEKLLQDAKKLT